MAAVALEFINAPTAKAPLPASVKVLLIVFPLRSNVPPLTAIVPVPNGPELTVPVELIPAINVPSIILTPPAYALLPESIRLPAPAFVKVVPVPVITPVIWLFEINELLVTITEPLSIIPNPKALKMPVVTARLLSLVAPTNPVKVTLLLELMPVLIINARDVLSLSTVVKKLTLPLPVTVSVVSAPKVTAAE